MIPPTIGQNIGTSIGVAVGRRPGGRLATTHKHGGGTNEMQGGQTKRTNKKYLSVDMVEFQQAQFFSLIILFRS